MILHLGHGAGGSAAAMAPHVGGLRRRGVEARAVQLPRRGAFPIRAEDAAGSFLEQSGSGGDVALGGHSYGGRVASLVAATTPVAGLVLMSYPLHPPRRPDAALRTGHWPRILCPVLLLSGDRDEFARLDLLRAAVGGLRDSRLIVLPGCGHDLSVRLDDVLDATAEFIRALG